MGRAAGGRVRRVERGEDWEAEVGRRRSFSTQLEGLLDARRWARAERVLRAQLERRRGDHWLLSRLSWVCFMRGQQTDALRYSAAAVRSQPRCPLALWDRAGALLMARRQTEADAIYSGLIRRGVERVAFGTCGEGLARARGTIADCHYMRAYLAGHRGDHATARKHIRAHLGLRGRGSRGVVSLRDARALEKRVSRLVNRGAAALD